MDTRAGGQRLLLTETSGSVRDAEASERVAAVRGGGGGALSTV
jgi:hypothetical protein